MSIYLDNAAAAPCDPELLAFFAACAAEFPGNQESAGYCGSLAARKIQTASEELTAAFRLTAFETFFANTGTEALAAAAEALCRNARKREIVTTVLEHPALESALQRSCARHGLQLLHCPADRSGVRLDVLESMLSDRTEAVALHHVQSETGGILDPAAVRAMIGRAAPEAALLLDTMQSIGKLPLDAAAWRPDFLFLSGQKLGAPGGAVLFSSKKYARTVKSLRSAEHFTGRCPVPVLLTAIRSGIRAAAEQPENHAGAVRLKKLLQEELRKRQLTFPATLPDEAASPFILHLLTAPYQGAILTRSLHRYQISAAPGSACESETRDGSRALSAMGYPRRDCFCGLRLSFWKGNTPEEMAAFAEKLAECVRNY